MKYYYTTEDGEKIFIENREYIDGVPIVGNMGYDIKIREFLRILKYRLKHIKYTNKEKEVDLKVVKKLKKSR